MPIQNIQGLVDKNGLSYISNFTRDYYEEGLANLGQRNTNDSLLENIVFNVEDIFLELNNYIGDPEHTSINNPFIYVIYYNDSPTDINSVGKFYTLNSQKIREMYQFNEHELYVLNSYMTNKVLTAQEEQTYYNYIESIISKLQDIVSMVQSDDLDLLKINGYIDELVISDENTNSTDNNYLILNKKLNIVAELFDSIYRNNAKDNLPQIRNYRMFLPINFQFGYIANSINKATIYHSFKDVYINSIPENFNNTEDDYELEALEFYLGNIFYCAQQKYVKTDIFEYLFSTTNNVENIECSKKFTFPYIDEDDYWVINNLKTSIQAKAHDAMNLNIILAYYYKDGNVSTYKYLSGLNHIQVDKIGIEDSADAVKFNIKSGEDIIYCSIQTPKIKSTDLVTKAGIKLQNVLEKSTLVIISKIADIVISGNNLEKYGDGFVTTMWYYDEDHFNYISVEDNIALDFNQLTNFDNLLKYEIKHVNQVEPDNFLHSHLIFDQIYQQLKQDNNKSVYSYPVLQNIKGSQYNNKYANNMNFSLKYVNYISGEIGVDIKGVSKGSDTKYLKNNNNISNSSNTVTNALYQYIVNNKVNYYNEYIPNYNVPVFDISEILVKDSNVINKQNIITFDYDGTMYYSYIGTSQNTKKNILTIGSSNIDINLGENTLTDYNTKKNFNTQNTINIDFNKIYANGKLTVAKDLEVGGDIILNNFEWNKSIINGIQIQSTSFVPQFKYYSFNNSLTNTNNIFKLININSLESDMRNLSINAANAGLTYGSDAAKYYLYICPIITVPHSSENNMPYYYKYNDLLVLPNLVNYLGLDPNIVVNFESNTNEIITVNGKQLYLVSSNNILANSISIVSSTDTGITIDLLNSKEFYLGNTLYITYVPSQNKLIVNEVQSSKIKSIWKIPSEIN